MPLKLRSPLFLNVKDAVIYDKPKIGKAKVAAVNHLIMGDYMKYLNESDKDWIKVRSRNTNGWLKKNLVTNDRMLEINFVDIGQGDGCHVVTPDDEVILIDAGEGIGFNGQGGDNMTRFINWRYNLRNRKVKGVDGIKRNDPQGNDPFEIKYAIASHPDLDHYYGFDGIFGNSKLKISNVYHNGIVERNNKGVAKHQWLWDLGESYPKGKGHNTYHLWDTVISDKEMKAVITDPKNSRKKYVSTLLKAYVNNKRVKYKFLSVNDKYLDHFNDKNKLTIEVLAPFTEDIRNGGKTRPCLVKLGNEGETKNGHSIVLKFCIGKLKVLLGGDLNKKSQDYIARKYSGIDTTLSELEKTIRTIRIKLSDKNLGQTKKDKLKHDIDEAEKMQELIISKTRRVFESDIAKACHHGASDVLDSFLRAINPVATVISSGDEESHSHPRPDALGAYGKTSRGDRPLIFSTELARSSTEFSYPIRFYEILNRMAAHRDTRKTKKEKAIVQKRMERLRDSNVAKYGMITVRTDGEKVIIAQKLEKKRSESQKWDIYELVWNEKLENFEYAT